MIIGVVHIGSSLKLFVCSLSSVSVTLLFSHLSVSILDRFFHGRASGLMLVLCLFQQLIEVQSLRIVRILSESLLFLEGLTFSDLLFNPILLL